MRRLLHPSSLRYALALWLATVLALLIAFVVQLEPAQWSGITVWIMFMQAPRLNYSKIVWWVFGTVTGALMAVVLIALFSQAPDLFLPALALWLAGCAALSTLVKSYKAYGLVLAGYTCAIVSMSAVDHPDLVFQLAVTRVSCIFIGMASAIVMMGLLLPKHRHWHETLHHLDEFFKASLVQVGKALAHQEARPHFTWRHMADRLSTVEHTLDITTAESPESRLRSPQARSLIATLFCVLGKAQSIEVHLSRPGSASPSPAVSDILARTGRLFTELAESASAAAAEEAAEAVSLKITCLANEAASLRAPISVDRLNDREVTNCFILNCLEEILADCSDAVRDWAGLFGPWKARRASNLSSHRDYRTAWRYGLRMALGMGLVSALWFITQWPSGSQLVLFMAVVCSLLSLLEHAPVLGWAFLKSAVFCATVAFIDTFWLLQKAEGFVFLALALGLFLVPAAYAYRHPRLGGSAVVSMLIFYGLSMPANQMNYDVVVFLNNALALLCAAACGFFAFHAVPSLSLSTRQFWLLHAVRSDLERAEMAGRALSEQRWTSRMFDRLRLLHRTDEKAPTSGENHERENEVLIGLQLGLRQIRLRKLLQGPTMAPAVRSKITKAFRAFRKLTAKPDAVSRFLRSTCSQVVAVEGRGNESLPESHLEAVAELREMALLIETVTPLYVD